VACVREGGGGSHDLGLGLIRAVDRAMDDCRGRGPAVVRTCGLGPLVHGGPS
jgi:hypothetical protein